jgi:phosphate transport system permease protein
MTDVALNPGVVARHAISAADAATRMRRRRRRETIFIGLGIASTLFALVTLAALLIDLAIAGIPRINWDFFVTFPSRRASQAGILSAWVGSLLVILVTAVIGVFLGVSAGIYLEEYARRNWITNIIEINISNLAGVPSIVYGLLALGLFVYTLGTGRSIFTAGLTLALLILPIIVVATREAIRAVPWSALPGVLTGVIIGISRALGETAPLITIGALTFIAFLPPSPITSEFPFISFQWLFEGFTVLPIQAFNWISRPGSDFHANAAAAGIVLLFITLGLNSLAIYARYQLRKKLQW